jgi:hypothetical protein
MNKKRLGCLTTGGLIALAITLFSVGTSYALTKNQMFSPGDLSSLSSGQRTGDIDSHADLKNDCQACHPAPWDGEDLADLCLDCHEDIQAQLENIRSLHGAVLEGLNSINCRSCHTDHLGEDASLTYYEGEDFPHDLVNFSLQSHQQLDWDREINCQDCHPISFRNFDPVLCENCHLEINRSFTDLHSSIYSMDCLSCHDGLETINSSFDHSQASFVLNGKHSQISCDACHSGSEDLDAFFDTPELCFECHLEDDIHLGFLGVQCQNCHQPTGWLPGLYDHTLTGFFLKDAHANLPCSDCHTDLTFQGQSPDCFSCHKDDEPHQGEFGTDCTICHSATTWTEIHFDHAGPYSSNCSYCHQKDSPINHYQAQCSACHITSAWLPATFNHAAVGATDCQSCHIQDRPANHFAGQCSICHSTSRWKPANFNHTFPITHGGAGGSCSKCHTTSNYYAYTCYQCHEHSKSEVKKEHEGVSNLDNCIRCHWDGRKHEDGGGDGD